MKKIRKIKVKKGMSKKLMDILGQDKNSTLFGNKKLCIAKGNKIRQWIYSRKPL